MPRLILLNRLSPKLLGAVGAIAVLVWLSLNLALIRGGVQRNLAMHALSIGVTSRQQTSIFQAEDYAQEAVRARGAMAGELAFRIGIAYEQLGMRDEANAQYEKAIHAGGNPPSMLGDLLFRVGVYSMNAGDTETAADYFQQLLAIDSDAVPIQTMAYANVYLGDILGAQTGDLTLERQYLEAAIDLLVDGLTMTRYRALATAMSKQDEYIDQSLEMAIIATEREPTNTWTTLTRCGVHLVRRELEEATIWCQRSAKADPKNPHAHAWLGIAYFRQGLWEEALAEYEIAATLDSNNDWYRQLIRNAQDEIAGQ